MCVCVCVCVCVGQRFILNVFLNHSLPYFFYNLFLIDYSVGGGREREREEDRESLCVLCAGRGPWKIEGHLIWVLET